MATNHTRPNPIIAQIPNSITGLNLLSGSLSLLMSLRYQELEYAAGFIILAAVFDFFDGLIARALGVSSPIGKDLDSLADVVSFGVAPGEMIWILLNHYYGIDPAWASIALLIGVFAGFRLAKFNNDTRQTTSFIGLPVPSNALFWIGYQALMVAMVDKIDGMIVLAITIPLVLLFSYLMVGELPMFSFKISKAEGGKKGSVLPQLSLVVVALVSIVAGWILGFGLAGFAVAILYYIIISIILATK